MRAQLARGCTGRHFEADTPAGKAFDVLLLVAIVLSVTVVKAESVASLRERFGREFDIAEWVFTPLFTVEYILRLVSVPRSAGDGDRLQYHRGAHGHRHRRIG